MIPLPIQRELLVEHGAYIFSGEINSNTAAMTVALLSRYASALSDRPHLLFYITSPGGGVEDALFLYDFLRFFDERVCPVITVAAGYCLSGAVVVLQGGRTRLSFPHTTFFLHQIIMESSEEKLSEVLLSTQFSIRLQNIMWRILEERSGGRITVKILKRRLKQGDWWLSAQDAVKYGLIDDILKEGSDIAQYLSLLSECRQLLNEVDRTD